MLSLFRTSANKHVIDRLHGEIMAAARNPALYLDCGAFDTFEGRFEIFTLHAALVLRRLSRLPSPGPEMAQDLSDAVARHFDIMLREFGYADVSVAKRMKKLTGAFLGRARAYDEALGAADMKVLEETIGRNALAGQGPAAPLTAYIRRYNAMIEASPIEVFSTGPLPSVAV
ncbi:ubiquinol-cytochrome c chaperone [Methylovirgula sp. 4M-Z18]|nr:ubiquinol-cytochrome c chaperone [Methylovirgula sp. 4M-Z18]